MLPIGLELRGRRAVVIGGGAVAERKVRALLAAGADDVMVIAPDVHPALESAANEGRIRLERRAYAPHDLAGARLVFAATNAPALNAAVVREARSRGALVDDASDAANSDFFSAATHRVGPLTFTVDSGGGAPAFAKRLRAELQTHFDERYGRAAETLAGLRTLVVASVPPAERAALLARLAARPLDELAALEPASYEDEILREREREPIERLVAASRASTLAMWQARHAGAILARCGIASTILPLSTRGDLVLDRSLSELGSDGVFVKELERALRERRADYAVHSCKDLPSTLPDDMHLAAIGRRDEPRDAFCSERSPSFEALPAGARVGTSSPRRRALLAALRPDLVYENLRGNLETRLRKLR
ncbi:MAG: hydroxymethylbilane synthase, partial [Vulcanimicrobiaceae bacterium]